MAFFLYLFYNSLRNYYLQSNNNNELWGLQHMDKYLTTGAQRSGRWEHCCDVLTLWSNITVVEGRLWQR